MHGVEAHNAVSIRCAASAACRGADAAEFILAGATAVSIGTANLYDPVSILAEFKAWASAVGCRQLIGALEC